MPSCCAVDVSAASTSALVDAFAVDGVVGGFGAGRSSTTRTGSVTGGVVYVATAGTAATVTRTLSVALPAAMDTVASPCLTPRTVPALSTVATPGFDDRHTI